MTAFESIPVYRDFFHSNLMVTLIWSFFLYTSLVYFIERLNKRQGDFPSLFGTEKRQLTPQEILRRGLLLVYAVIGSSLFFVTLLGEDGASWKAIGITAAAFTAFMCVKLLMLSTFMATFFPRKRSLFVSQYLTLVLYFGLFLFAAFAGLHFTPQALHLPILVVVAAGVLAMCAWLLYLFFKTFFDQGGYFFYFILYLCTLEILPLMLLFKEMWKANIFTHILNL